MREAMLKKAGKHVLILAASVALGMIAGFIVAVLTAPFWGWFEKTSGIESLGHSGPADWVFEFLVGSCTVLFFVVLEYAFREGHLVAANSQDQ